MKTVRDVMCPVRDVLQTTDSVADAARYLASHDEDSVALCRADGSLAGTVSNRDIVAQVVARELDPRRMPLSPSSAAAMRSPSTSTCRSKMPPPS
jgi:CBS domain-containing protein